MALFCAKGKSLTSGPVDLQELPSSTIPKETKIVKTTGAETGPGYAHPSLGVIEGYSMSLDRYEQDYHRTFSLPGEPPPLTASECYHTMYAQPRLPLRRQRLPTLGRTHAV